MTRLLYEMTASGPTRIQAKIAQDVSSWPELEVIALTGDGIADKLYALGAPFSRVSGIMSVEQLAAQLDTEYHLTDQPVATQPLGQLMANCLTVSFQSAGSHLFAGWLTIRERHSRALILDARVLDSVPV